jgi:hypothetical protein
LLLSHLFLHYQAQVAAAVVVVVVVGVTHVVVVVVVVSWTLPVAADERRAHRQLSRY